MIIKKTDYSTTFYLSMFLVVDIVIVGVMLCFFSQRGWWNNWMVTVPNLFMVLGALFCFMMQKNHSGKMTWLYIYKGVKIVLSGVMVLLYILLVKENAKAFVLVTAVCYIVGLILETFSVVDYWKRLKRVQ